MEQRPCNLQISGERHLLSSAWKSCREQYSKRILLFTTANLDICYETAQRNETRNHTYRDPAYQKFKVQEVSSDRPS